MRRIFIAGIVLVCAVAFAQTVEKIRSDQMQLGQGGSTADKSIIFDTGDGVGNPKLTVEQSSRDFILSNPTNITGDSLKLGDGTAVGDKVIEFDNGNAPDNPSLIVDESTSVLDFLNIFSLSIGDENNTQDKELVFNRGAGASNPRIKWDETSDRLQFSNDGATFSNIGSGSGGGGGINLLAELNGDFEAGDPPNDWTVTGGTFDAETTNPAFGAQSGSWNPTLTGQQLRSSAPAIPQGLYGQSCSIKFTSQWSGGVPGEIIWRIEDSSDNVIAGPFDAVASTGYIPNQAFFTCPSSGDIRIEFEATADAALILLDNVQLGQDLVAATPGNELLGTKLLTADVTTDGEMLDLTFDNLVVGKWYTVEAQFALQVNVGSGNNQVAATAVHDGVALAVSEIIIRSASTLGDRSRYGMAFTFKATDTVLRFDAGSAAVNSPILGANNRNETWVDVFVRNDLEANPQEALNLETTGFKGEMTYTGQSSTFSNGVNDFPIEAAYSKISEVGNVLDVACASGEVPSGDTCTGDEAVGVSFVPQIAGQYEVCMTLTHAAQTGGNAVIATFFELEKFTPGTLTILDPEESPTYGSRLDTGTSGGVSDKSHMLCRRFNLSPSEGRVEFKVTRSVTSSGSVLNNRQVGRWQARVILLDNQFPTPVFTDLTDSLDSKLETGDDVNIQTCMMSSFNTETGSLNGVTGGCVQSTTTVSLGTMDFNFVPGYFNGPVRCVCSAVNSSLSSLSCVTNIPSSSSVRIRTNLTSTASPTAGAVTVLCYGPR